MRTLSSTLTAAQQQPTSSPLAQAILRARVAGAARLDTTSLITAQNADTPHAIAAAAYGPLARARIAAGVIQNVSHHHWTMSAAVYGLGANPLIQFWNLPPAGSYTIVQPYSTATAAPWAYNNPAAGQWNYQAWAKAQGSPNSYDAYTSFTLADSVNLGAGPVCGVTANSINATAATYTASSVGLTNPQYAWWMFIPGVGWTNVGPYSSSPTYTYNLTLLPTGTQALELWAKSSGSPNSYDCYAQYHCVVGNPGLAAGIAPLPVPSVATTGWLTGATATLPGNTGGGVSIAARPNSNAVTIAYLGANNTTIAIQDSANSGISYGTAANLAAVGPVRDLALAYAPNGDLLLVAALQGSYASTWRRAAGTTTWTSEPNLSPPAATSITSIALAYSGADWYALFSWTTGSAQLVGSAIYGNGGQQALNTWSAAVTDLGMTSGAAYGPAPRVSGFAWGSDGGHMLLVEQWSSATLTSNQSFHAVCDSTANFAAGYWTEPAPWPYTAVSGAALTTCLTQPGQYAAGAENLLATLAQPADIDVSSRIVSLKVHTGQHHGTAQLILDNADSSLTSLATTRDSIGKRLDLSFGFATTAGNEYSPQPSRWVSAVTSSWTHGRQLLTIEAVDGWQLLHLWEARRQYAFGSAGILPAQSVDQIIAWLLMRAGQDYTTPAASTLRSRTPQFHILPGHSAGAAMLELMDKIEGWLIMRATDTTVIPLATGDPTSYSYSQSGHPIIQVIHRQETQAANIINVYQGARGLTLAGQAWDTGDAHLIGAVSHNHSDTQLEQANAALTASSLLRKAQLSPPTHEIVVLPNVGQELGDVVTLTDPLTGTSWTGRVREYELDLNRDNGAWQQRLSLTIA